MQISNKAAGQRVVEWLSAKGVKGCRFCGHQHLEVEQFVTSQVIDPVAEVAVNSHFPMAVVVCANCRCVTHVSIATIPGIMPEAEDPSRIPSN